MEGARLFLGMGRGEELLSGRGIEISHFEHPDLVPVDHSAELGAGTFGVKIPDGLVIVFIHGFIVIGHGIDKVVGDVQCDSRIRI